MKLKYTGKETVYLRKHNSTMKLRPGQEIDVTERESERFKDRTDFEKITLKKKVK